MNFKDLYIFDIYGAARLPLSGEFNAQQLADRLTQEWIPFVECHKCGRFDYCKFVQRYPQNPNRAKEIKCGVVETTLRLFIEHTFSLLEKSTHAQRQDYLDAAYHLSQFILDAETDIGRLMNRDHVEYWMDLGPSLFGSVIGLREHLDKIAEKMRSIPDLRSKRSVLFVVGYSEHAFLSKLRESHIVWFLNLIIEVYEGRGNRRPRRIEMLLERYQKQGYNVAIQGGADGGNTDCFHHIETKGVVASDRTFVFKFDFETSIPPRLLLHCLQQIGELEDVSTEDFRAVLQNPSKSIVRTLLDEYSLDIEPLKLALACQIGDTLNHSETSWWHNEEFRSTELGQFLTFIQNIY